MPEINLLKSLPASKKNVKKDQRVKIKMLLKPHVNMENYTLMVQESTDMGVINMMGDGFL